jgi:hypothetical protein
MLVPERGDPTTKIGLFVSRCIQVLRIIHLFASSQAWRIFAAENCLMNPIEIGPGGEFALGGENFVIEVGVPPKDRHPSTSEIFTIEKNEPYLRVDEDLASGFSPRSILELGIFQGGSYVSLDKLFKPNRMSAVEISSNPVAPLLDYVSRTKNRFVHFGTSQCDGDKLSQIVLGEPADELDLVADDASHTYEETRASFEFLFPLLSPGGIYVIEDWSWAHHPDYQSPDAPFQRAVLCLTSCSNKSC